MMVIAMMMVMMSSLQHCSATWQEGKDGGHVGDNMLEPGVFGSWEDVVGAAELSDAPQTVEFQGVEECLIHNIKNHI